MKEIEIGPCWSDTLKTKDVEIKGGIAASIKKEHSIVLFEPEVYPDCYARIRFSFPPGNDPLVSIGLLDVSKD
jgi:hypothetical protein